MNFQTLFKFKFLFIIILTFTSCVNKSEPYCFNEDTILKIQDKNVINEILSEIVYFDKIFNFDSGTRYFTSEFEGVLDILADIFEEREYAFDYYFTVNKKSENIISIELSDNQRDYIEIWFDIPTDPLPIKINENIYVYCDESD
ncbi:MAG: hypothetical protein HRU38_00305 [Saccharospirillaceae bacterium]|nr:hypothetical protein [Pseudomonadales bacterium]NRB77103.1 hypothetical protein [Saccharospirillaceae bacterium]